MRPPKVLLWAKPSMEPSNCFEDMASNNYLWVSEKCYHKKGGRHEVNAFTMLASKVDALFQKVDDSNLPLPIVVPLAGCLSKLIYAQCVEFKDIIGMSANSVIHSKTSPSKKPRTSITSTIGHQITLTLIPLTRVGEATPIFPTKNPNLLPHHLSQNHPHPPDFQYQAP